MNIHISRDGRQFGPYTSEQVREYLSTGSVLPTDLAWHEGATDWLPVTDVMRGSTVLQGSAATAVAVTCPKCAGPLESDQVVCLECGHNVDDPPPSEEEQAAAAKARFEANRVPVPLPLSYEDETATRSSAVNSVGWGLLFACVLPVFGSAAVFDFPIYDMWAGANAIYTWQMMFDVIAPAVAGIVCCVLATAMHGRGRGGILLGLSLIILIAGLVDPEVGEYKVQFRDDNSTVPVNQGNEWEAPENANPMAPDIPETGVEAIVGNQFFDKVFDPAKYPALMAVFLLAWVGIVGGAKLRFFRPENLVAYIMALTGAVAVCLMWLLPVADGDLPLMLAVNAISNDPLLGAGLVFMCLMQIGAAVFCFINRRGIRPSLIKKYSNWAGTLLMASVLVPVLPMWGKVIYEESNKHTELTTKRYKYVEGQFGTMWTGFDQKNRELHMRKLKKPLNARISSIFGWFATGAKYVAWLGGVFLLLPMAIVELLCGKREREGQFF